MACMPWSVLVERVAVEVLMGAVPKVVEPSRKVTVPVGLVPLTVAVSVTVCPRPDGFDEETSVVVVGYRTVCMRLMEVLPVLVK